MHSYSIQPKLLKSEETEWGSPMALNSSVLGSDSRLDPEVQSIAGRFQLINGDGAEGLRDPAIVKPHRVGAPLGHLCGVRCLDLAAASKRHGASWAGDRCPYDGSV